jgi:hypothetical protein
MPRGVYDRNKNSDKPTSKGRPRLSTAKTIPTFSPAEMNPAPKKTGFTKEMREAKEKAVDLALSSIDKAFPSGAKMQRKPKEDFDVTLSVPPLPAFDGVAQDQLRALQSHLTCLVTNRTTLEGSPGNHDLVEILEEEIIEVVLTMGAFRIKYFGEVETKDELEPAPVSIVPLDPNRPARPGQVGLPSQMPAGQAPFIPPTA